MKNITYNLNLTENNSNEFYLDLSIFSKEFLSYILENANNSITYFQQYIKEKDSPKRTYEEYSFEFLMIGVFWKTYSLNSSAFSNKYGSILEFLYNLRRKHTRIKKFVDIFRGVLSDRLHRKGEKTEISLLNFKKLIKWMASTGEFREECKRFENWSLFLQTIDEKSANLILNDAIKIAKWFSKEGQLKLGKYMPNVESFIDNNRSKYRYKENSFFCTRNKDEYLLNMVGADIMNSILKDRFDKTIKKVVLLPKCMANPSGVKCMAKKSGLEESCVSCSGKCQINKIKQQGNKNDFSINIIPHSSDFTKWLELFKNQDHTGVIGVACILNLLKGGYEMRGLDIPSQCVFLDFCGCKNHWSKEGIPTELNFQKLLQTIK